MHDRATPVRAVAGLDEVAVVVPLDVVDVVLVEEGEHLALDVRVRAGVGEVEHLLVAGLDGQLFARRGDPLGMLAREVAVEVDHLGLEPQPELHAQLVHAVDEGVQPVGPDLARDDPVAETCTVVAAASEPAVVEDEPLDAEVRGPLRQRGELVAVVAEVHRLPDVERHGAVGPGRVDPAAQVCVEAVGAGIQPLGERPVDPRTLVRLAVPEDDLAGQEDFAAAQHLLARMDALCVVAVVAAPRGVDGPDPALGESEPGDPGVQHERAVGARPPSAVLPQVRPGAQGQSLRRALAVVLTREVEDLDRLGREGVRERQIIEGVRCLRQVRDTRARAQQATRQQCHGEGEFEPSRVVDGVERQLARGGLDEAVDGRAVEAHGVHDEARRPPRAGERARDAWPADPPGVMLGQEGEAQRGVGVVRAHDGDGRGAQLRCTVRIERREGGSPVHDRGKPPSARVDDDGDAGVHEVHDRVGVIACHGEPFCSHPFSSPRRRRARMRQ